MSDQPEHISHASGPRDIGGVVGHGVVLTGSALVPLGIVVSIILSVVGATWWISGELNSIRTEIHNLRTETSIATSARWHYFDERVQWEKFRAANPGLVIPDPIHYPLPGESVGDTRKQ